MCAFRLKAGFLQDITQANTGERCLSHRPVTPLDAWDARGVKRAAVPCALEHGRDRRLGKCLLELGDGERHLRRQEAADLDRAVRIERGRPEVTPHEKGRRRRDPSIEERRRGREVLRGLRLP